MKDKKDTQFEVIKKGFGYIILTFLYSRKNRGDVYGSMISKNSPIAEANISTVLKKLEKLGLIERKVSPKSKRVKILTLTNEGIELTKLLIQVDGLLDKLKEKTKEGGED